MSKFTAKAFVKINNDDKKQDVFFNDLLLSNNMLETSGMYSHKAEYIFFDEGFLFDCEEQHIDSVKDGFIDCNHYANGDEETAVALFLELAKMRDDTDKDQWFITEADRAWVNQGIYSPKGSFEKCLVEDRNMGLGDAAMLLSSICPAHKATHLELAKAVQRGEVKLK